jgi:hypothetical protein
MKNFKKEVTYTHVELCNLLSSFLIELNPNKTISLYNNIFKNNDDIEYKGNDTFILTKYAPMQKGESDHIVVGAYYKLPNNSISYIYGCHGLKREISYYFDDDEGGKKASFEKVKSWKIRKDLKDFPDAKDPKLPYVFDLFWDIKHESELKKLIAEHSENWLKHEGVIEEIYKEGLANKFFSNKIIDNL